MKTACILFRTLGAVALVAGDHAPAAKRQVVNFATVVRLAGAGNLDIRLANERVAEQDITRARLDYLGVVTEHNRAQFLLRRAIAAEAVVAKRKK